MQPRWFLSQTYLDVEHNMRIPVCTAYGSQWTCPTLPATDDGWCLVLMATSPMQIAACKQDPRVMVCPLVFDPTPLPQAVIDAYASWGATLGMTMGALLATLAEVEPIFGHTTV
jgi:hypothetical protein